MRVFIGMETSGVMRLAFKAAGHEVISCDLLACQDQAEPFQYPHECVFAGYGHIVGDVFETLDKLRELGWWPDLAIFHPDCTFFTVSAAWAFGPGPYHQKVKPGTLTGQARKDRQAQDLKGIHRIARLPIRTKIIENPIGMLSSLWQKPSDIVQPYEFGDDASKATCFWILDKDGSRIMAKLPRDPTKLILPTERPNGKRYWSNQTDTGQNRLSPGADRWQKRADTYPGIASAIVEYFTRRDRNTQELLK